MVVDCPGRGDAGKGEWSNKTEVATTITMSATDLQRLLCGVVTMMDLYMGRRAHNFGCKAAGIQVETLVNEVVSLVKARNRGTFFNL